MRLGLVLENPLAAVKLEFHPLSQHFLQWMIPPPLLLRLERRATVAASLSLLSRWPMRLAMSMFQLLLLSVPAPASRPVAAAPGPDLPWVPPVAGMGYVGAGAGEATAPFVPPRRAVAGPSVAPPPSLPDPAARAFPLQVQVPTATLGQLWRLVECQQALTLILVNSHSAILRSPESILDPGPRADCLTAAPQFALLLLPVLASPAQEDVAVSQLDDTIQGLTRHLHAGGGVEAVGATALVVRQLWRTMRGILAALDAHLM
ncbi:unnamed protein product [Closterium sp. Naga37s-1]|nr:unnamed protein product [Closterium sp. Naga37s-1]